MTKAKSRSFCFAFSGLFLCLWAAACSSSVPQESLKSSKVVHKSRPVAERQGGSSALVSNSQRSAEKPSPERMRLSLRFDPPQPVTGDTLRAVVDLGQDGEPTDSSLIVRWTVNGKELDQTGETLQHELVYGDFVTATAELQGAGDRPRRVSASVVVGNGPPSVSILHEALKDGEFSATVDVRDPEGDPVNVELSEGPEGMFWNAEKKAILWRPSPSQRGVFHVRLEARDPAGNAGAYSFDVTVSEPAGGAPSREEIRP